MGFGIIITRHIIIIITNLIILRYKLAASQSRTLGTQTDQVEMSATTGKTTSERETDDSEENRAQNEINALQLEKKVHTVCLFPSRLDHKKSKTTSLWYS